MIEQQFDALARSQLAFGVLGLAARGLTALAGRAGRIDGVRRQPTLRLALANLTRPGAATVSVILSLGLGYQAAWRLNEATE